MGSTLEQMACLWVRVSCGSRGRRILSHGESVISSLVEETQISSEKEGVGLLKLPQGFVVFLAFTSQLAHV